MPPLSEPAQPAQVGVRAQVFSTGLRAEDLQTQSLFRVHYQGPDGSGAFRLVLKLESAERYLIETKDRFGRGLWRIEANGSGTVLVDDRRKIFCASEDGIRIPEITLESLPLEELRWAVITTLTASGPEPSGWTLWQNGEPWLWWHGEAAGEGMLSHRAGTQLRWKRVAGEPLSGEIAPLVLTPKYESVACDAWP